MSGGLDAKSCSTLVTPMDCSLPGSSVHGILQAKILEWVAIFIRTSSVIRYLKMLLRYQISGADGKTARESL